MDGALVVMLRERTEVQPDPQTHVCCVSSGAPEELAHPSPRELAPPIFVLQSVRSYEAPRAVSDAS
jgi:hypothetical protein